MGIIDTYSINIMKTLFWTCACAYHELNIGQQIGHYSNLLRVGGQYKS